MNFCCIRKTKFHLVLISYLQTVSVNYLQLSLAEPTPLVTWTRGPNCHEEFELVAVLTGPLGHQKRRH